MALVRAMLPSAPLLPPRQYDEHHSLLRRHARASTPRTPKPFVAYRSSPVRRTARTGWSAGPRASATRCAGARIGTLSRLRSCTGARVQLQLPRSARCAPCFLPPPCPSLPNNRRDRANVAKYRAHAHLQRDLLSTGCAVLNGAASTSWACAGKMHNWSVWNGLIQVRACDCGGRLVVGALQRRCDATRRVMMQDARRCASGRSCARWRSEGRGCLSRSLPRWRWVQRACLIVGVAVEANACVCQAYMQTAGGAQAAIPS
jgi:hypothetical protein